MNQNVAVINIPGLTDEEIYWKFARTVIALSACSTTIMVDRLESMIREKIGCDSTSTIDYMKFFLSSLSIEEQKDIVDSCVVKDEKPVLTPTLNDIEFLRPYKLPGLYDCNYIRSKRKGTKKKRRYK